jgi:hypothetical protein
MRNSVRKKCNESALSYSRDIDWAVERISHCLPPLSVDYNEVTVGSKNIPSASPDRLSAAPVSAETDPQSFVPPYASLTPHRKSFTFERIDEVLPMEVRESLERTT